MQDGRIIPKKGSEVKQEGFEHRQGGDSGTGTRRDSADGFARKMKDHQGVFAAGAPGPGLRDVILVVESEDQAVLVSGGLVGQVRGASELEGEFLDGIGGGDSPHAGLIIGRTVVNQGDGVPIERIEGEHGLHVHGGKRFDDDGARCAELEFGMGSHAVAVGALPLPS